MPDDSTRLKILFTIAWMEMGGSQTHLLQVFRLIDRTCFQPVLYCLTGKGALLQAARDMGITVVDGRMSRGFGPLESFKGALRLARYLRKERFDVVHNYLLRANLVGSIGARLAGVPVILCSKRGCHERRGGELASVRMANCLAHGVTTNAEAVRDFVHENERYPKDRMIVIPSGVDTSRFCPLGHGDHRSRLGLDPHRPVVGTVTRMRVRKGVEEFVRAMLLVRERFPGAQGVIAGEVELDDDLRDLVCRGGMERDLRLLGMRDDMPEVLAAFDVFVLASHDEGMSNAILEAMSMQLPVVATDVGGTGEVVRPRETGLLVPPRAPLPLAEAINELLGAPRRRADMGRLSRRVVEESFSAGAMVREMEALYVKMRGGAAIGD